MDDREQSGSIYDILRDLRIAFAGQTAIRDWTGISLPEVRQHGANRTARGVGNANRTCVRSTETKTSGP